MAAAVARTPSLDLVTCFSRDDEKRQAFALECGCEAAPSFEAAIEDARVEAVLLVTPNFVHREQAVACAERGKHVFVEKPIADTLEDGRAMAAACEAAGVTLQVGHGLRRLGAARAAERLVREGALGRVVLAEANFSLPGTLKPHMWRYRRETCPGGPLLQLGVHHVDTLLHWLGPAARVQGSFARLVTDAEIDDLGIALVEHESGARSLVSSSYVSPKTFSSACSARRACSTSSRTWRSGHASSSSTARPPSGSRPAEGAKEVSFEARDVLVEELDELARCVRGEAVPETGAAEGLAALGVVLAAIESHEQRDGRGVAPGR